MSEERWALIRRRIYRSLPFIQLILGATVVTVSSETWMAITGLAAVWLLSPTSGEFAARHVDVELARENDAMMTAYVSRETSYGTAMHEAVELLNEIPLPCAAAHGSAEPHVPTCEGWTNPRV